MIAVTRYIVILVPNDVAGGTLDWYGVVDTQPGSGVDPIIARCDSLSTANAIRDALNGA